MKPLWLVCAVGAAAATFTFATGDAAAETSTTQPIVQDAVEAAAKTDKVGVSVKGVIKFKGEHKPLPPLSIGKDASTGCGEVPMEDRSLLVDGNGGIANVVVSLKAKDFKVQIPKEPVVIDQRGCRFEPHVMAVPAGTTLRFLNSDGTNHNIHTYAKKNQNKNNNVSGGQNLDHKVDQAEVFEVKCDIHPWMKGYVFVTKDTHFAVTNVAGEFELKGVPDGAYKLSLWHETMGKAKTKEVTVKNGTIAEITHEWEKAAKGKGKGKRGGRRKR